MPIYEYICQACGHEFELLVMGSERPACPGCDSKKLEKKFSSFSSGGGTRSAPRFSAGGG